MKNLRKNRRWMKHIFYFILHTSYIIFILSCSSAPKRAMVVRDETQKGYDFYEKANALISEGEVEKALDYLDKSYKIAVSVDNNDLMCKVLLSAVTRKMICETIESKEENQSGADEIYFGTDRDIPSLMSEAKTAAKDSDDKATLEAIVKIFECRVAIHNAKNLAANPDGRFEAESAYSANAIQSELDGLTKSLDKQPYYLAYLYRTKGEASSLSGDDANAAKYFEKAAEIHTKERYLSDIGYDWYLAAQSYSRAGDKSNAVKSIQNAIKYDKDAENTNAIAKDFMAVAKILLKGNPSAIDRENAKVYAQKAKRIYEATGDVDSAVLCEEFLLTVSDE